MQGLSYGILQIEMTGVGHFSTVEVKSNRDSIIKDNLGKSRKTQEKCIPGIRTTKRHIYIYNPRSGGF